MRNYALLLLHTILQPSSKSSVLEIDAFGLLVGLFSSLPSLTVDRTTETCPDTKGVPQFNPILVR